MTVKMRKSSAKAQPSEPPPEPRRPEPSAPDPAISEVRPASSRRPEPSAPERQNSGGDAAPAHVSKHAGTISITLPSYSFAPLKYGSFVVPAVSMTVAVDEASQPVEETALTALSALRDLQESLYDQELKTYFDRAERAYKEAARRFGADE